MSLSFSLPYYDVEYVNQQTKRKKLFNCFILVSDFNWLRIRVESAFKKMFKNCFLVLNELVAAGGGGGVILGEHVLGEHVCATLLALATTTFIQG